MQNRQMRLSFLFSLSSISEAQMLIARPSFDGRCRGPKEICFAADERFIHLSSFVMTQRPRCACASVPWLLGKLRLDGFPQLTLNTKTISICSLPIMPRLKAKSGSKAPWSSHLELFPPHNPARPLLERRSSPPHPLIGAHTLPTARKHGSTEARHGFMPVLEVENLCQRRRWNI